MYKKRILNNTELINDNFGRSYYYFLYSFKKIFSPGTLEGKAVINF